MDKQQFGPTSSSPKSRWPVVVRQMGRSIFDPIWSEREHVDANSELIYVLQGRVRIETPRYTLNGRSGDTLFTPANMPHRDVFPSGTLFEVYLVQFEWADEAAMLRQIHPLELTRAASRSHARFGRAFEQLYGEFVNVLAYQSTMMSIQVSQILYELFRAAAMNQQAAGESSEQATTGRRSQIMHRARQLIDERLNQPISLDALAEAIGISTYYLSRVFSQESGFTLSSYIMQQRMNKAQKLLAEGDRSIKEIAFATGFRDGHYFSRVFRGHFNVSPSIYRRQIIRSS